MSRAIHPVVVGTAGHIDHGKSTLVRALTGVDPDRLKEEKERGLTIDLGFAPLALPDGRVMGIVDVPGHERFVRNMVAGSTALDMAILVVAADDGVMPQTREHLDIIHLLGVSRGIVALTKVDLVDEDLVELAEQDVREVLVGTPLAAAEIVRISSVTGAGVEGFAAKLAMLAVETPARSHEGPFRMAIQRVFQLKGIGTVVTGIPMSGEVQMGDSVEFLPGGRSSKIRAIQAYKGAVDRAVAGHSTALSVPDVKVSQLHRGVVAGAPGVFRSGDTIDVELRLLENAETLTHRTPIRFHAGTSETKGLLILLQQESVQPGDNVVARLSLDRSVCVVYGDRYLLRLQNPVRTVGGGRVLRLTETGGRYRRRVLGDELTRLVEAGPGVENRVLEELHRAGGEGRTAPELAGSLGVDVDEVSAMLVRLPDVHMHTKAGRAFLTETLEDGKVMVRRSVERILKSKPLAASVQRSQLKTSKSLPGTLLTAVFAAMQAAGEIRSSAHGRILFLERLKPLSPTDQAALDRLVAISEERGFRPPQLQELVAESSLPARQVEGLLARAIDEGRVEQVGEHLYGASVIRRALVEIYRNCMTHDEELAIPDLRDALGTSRKFLIPLLEYVDSLGMTRLRGGVRRLLPTSVVCQQIAAAIDAS
ncbi:MAG: selenocysteine-specific translation elongation factor [Planctomycetota bacterium]|jgi:selenocysteine-specific elongation factor